MKHKLIGCLMAIFFAANTVSAATDTPATAFELNRENQIRVYDWLGNLTISEYTWSEFPYEIVPNPITAGTDVYLKVIVPRRVVANIRIKIEYDNATSNPDVNLEVIRSDFTVVASLDFTQGVGGGREKFLMLFESGTYYLKLNCSNSDFNLIECDITGNLWDNAYLMPGAAESAAGMISTATFSETLNGLDFDTTYKASFPDLFAGGSFTLSDSFVTDLNLQVTGSNADVEIDTILYQDIGVDQFATGLFLHEVDSTTLQDGESDTLQTPAASGNYYVSNQLGKFDTSSEWATIDIDITGSGTVVTNPLTASISPSTTSTNLGVITKTESDGCVMSTNRTGLTTIGLMLTLCVIGVAWIRQRG